jgi:hypothetical protein
MMGDVRATLRSTRVKESEARRKKQSKSIKFVGVI